MDPKSDSAPSDIESSLQSKQCESESAGIQKPKEKYKCTESGCSFEFSKSSRLASHVRQHTGERPYKCDHAGCIKAYTNTSHLKRHYETHNPVKQTYKCKMCSLNITNRHNLKRHYERVHKQRFACDTCGMTFSKERKFIEHKATHDGSSLYNCDICKKNYLTLRRFKRHQETHDSKKEYPCTASDCTEVFSKWSLLCNHMKIKHISQFKCNDCNKVFLNKTHLKSHSVVHSETRSIITCPYEKCPRFYFFKRNLDHHVRTSHLGKKLECDICKISLSSKQKLIEHMTKIHQSRKKKKLVKKTERSKRKNSGLATKSMVSKLVGLDLSFEIEKSILKRRSKIKLSKEFVESSESEADRERVIKDLEENLRKVLNEVPQNGDLPLSEHEKQSDLEESPNEVDNNDQLKIPGNIDPLKNETMAAVNLKSMSAEKIADFLNSFDTVLTDCDGVLWTEMVPLPYSADVMNIFRKLGKRVFYITNNSTKTRAEFVEKCGLLNFKATEEEILCTSYLSACYLQDQGFKKKVYVIGSQGITKELDRLGIAHCGLGADVVRSDVSYRSFEKDPDVGAVIVGFDEHFSYPKLLKAATYLDDENVHFVGTNTDERFPIASNIVIPGTGTLVRCVETCAERKAVIVGKPETYISQAIKKRFGVDPKRTLMIGDRCNTDILLGTRCGFRTLLVLTGITSIEEVENWKQSESQEDKDLVPDYYTDKLGDLLPHLQKLKDGQLN